MCRSVRQTSQSILPLPNQQYWVPGGMEKILKIVMIGHSCRKFAELLIGDETVKECSNTRGVNCTVRRTHWDIWTINMFSYVYIYLQLPG